MKKIIPYILAVILGYLISNLIFDYQNIKMTGFQLGVYNNITLAKEYSKKYPSSIIIKDDDVSRLYYSILSNNGISTAFAATISLLVRILSASDGLKLPDG